MDTTELLLGLQRMLGLAGNKEFLDGYIEGTWTQKVHGYRFKRGSATEVEAIEIVVPTEKGTWVSATITQENITLAQPGARRK